MSKKSILCRFIQHSAVELINIAFASFQLERTERGANVEKRVRGLTATSRSNNLQSQNSDDLHQIPFNAGITLGKVLGWIDSLL
jgi:hypothetical protein